MDWTQFEALVRSTADELARHPSRHAHDTLTGLLGAVGMLIQSEKADRKTLVALERLHAYLSQVRDGMGAP